MAATEPDQQFEGVAAPDQLSEQELDDPGFDPGGETALPFETAPAPSAPDGSADEGTGAPVDAEPSVDLDARLVPVAEAEAPGSEQDAGVPSAEVAPPGAAAPSPTPLTPGEPTDQQPGATDPGSAERQPAPEGRVDRPEKNPGSSRGATSYRQVGPQAHDPPRAPVAEEHPPAPVPSGVPVSVTETDAPSPHESGATAFDDAARVHTVQPGDTLWSIAKRLLGRNPSPARIAREVDRLWSLNSSRIATGDPDLLMVGTRLELR